MELDIRPLNGETWPALAALFEEGGDPKWCWCQFWRAAGFSPNNPDQKAINRANLRAQADRPLAPGLVAIGLDGKYQGKAAGWVSLGPREDYERLERSRSRPRLDPSRSGRSCASPWPATPGAKGSAAQLLEAAIAYAREHGAPTAGGLSGRYVGRQADAADSVHRHLVDVPAGGLRGCRSSRVAAGDGRSLDRPAGADLMAGRPIVVDCDTGIDDSLALLYLLGIGRRRGRGDHLLQRQRRGPPGRREQPGPARAGRAGRHRGGPGADDAARTAARDHARDPRPAGNRLRRAAPGRRSHLHSARRRPDRRSRPGGGRAS